MALSDAVGGREVFATIMVAMEFTTGTRRWWPGFGDIVSGGHTWQGTGEFLSISEVPRSDGLQASGLTVTLSGVDADVVNAVENAATVAYGRPVTVFAQTFRRESTAAGLLWGVPDADPEALWLGIMDEATIATTVDASTGIPVSVATLTCENIWVYRNRTAAGNYTPVDQRLRFAGDAGCDYIGNLRSSQVIWS